MGEADVKIKLTARLVIRGFTDQNDYGLKETSATESSLSIVRAMLRTANIYGAYTTPM